MNDTHFLNIDLDIESEINIDLLVEELSKSLVFMTHHVCNGIFRASFESHQFEIDLIIAEFVEAINTLSPFGRAQWESSTKREFNIGFSAGSIPRSYMSEISLSSLTQLVDVKGSLGITIYAEKNDF